MFEYYAYVRRLNASSPLYGRKFYQKATLDFKGRFLKMIEVPDFRSFE